MCLALITALCSLAQPTISSFTPTSGAIGTPVTITGTNFSSTAANNIVYFGAVKGNVTAASATSLTVTVPPGANSDRITVTTGNLTAWSAKPFSITFPAGVLRDYSSFGDNQDVNTGVRPYGLAIADLDGDGKADIAAANSGVPLSTFAVLRNTSTTGTVSFAAKINYSTFEFPYSIAAGDLDGDGKKDLAVTAISGNGSITIFKNNSTTGNISLSKAASYSTGFSPYKVVIADIDLDGKADLITSNYVSNSISVFLNTSTGGTISFAAKTDFTTNLAPYSVCVADFDGDGKPDMAASNQLSNTISLFRNTSTPGSISFAAKTEVNAGSSPFGITTGDIDEDGKPDIAFVNNGDVTASVIKNISTPGTISFSARTNYSLSSSTQGPYDVVLSDVDGDGKPDMTVTGPVSLISVFKNASTSGNILFNTVFFYSASSPYHAGYGDFDGDGKADLAVSNFIGNTVTVLRNRVNEPFISSFTPTEGSNGTIVTIIGNNFTGTTGVSFGGVAASSFTVDDATTITAVVGNGASGEVKITTPYGIARLDGFTYVTPPTITNFTPKSMGAGGLVTITGTSFIHVTGVSFGGVPAEHILVNSSTKITATVAEGGATGAVEVSTTSGTASMPGFTFIPKPVITSFTPGTGGTGTSIVITGTNLTGASSVLIGGVAATSVTVNSPTSITAVVGEGASGSLIVTTPGGKDTSDTYFSFPPPTITSFTPASGVVGSTVTITGANFRPTLAGNIVYFGATKATVTAASTTSLTVKVPDGATFVPLTVTVNNQTAFANKPFNTTFPDAGAGITDNTFGWKRGPATGGETKKIIIQDMDGDGRPDLVYHNNSSGGISILKHNTVTQTLGFSAYIDVINGLWGVAVTMTVGDVNGDGKPDIIVSYGTQVYVYRNTSVPNGISFAAPVAFLSTIESRGVTIADMDGDARADIIVTGSDFNLSNPSVSIYRNIGFGDSLEFAAPVNFDPGILLYGIHVADFDGDGKPDVAGNSASNTGVVSVLRNTSTTGTISLAPYMHIPTGNATFEMAIADFNGDNKPDIVASNYYDSSFYIVKNNSISGNLAFAAAVPTLLHKAINHIITGQLDGDGKPDIVVVDEINKQLCLFRNTSTAATISFAASVNLQPKLTFNFIRQTYIGDLDGDQKPDIVATHASDAYVSIFRNQSGEKLITVCAGMDTTLTAGTGSSYQWQVQLNASSSFTNVPNNTVYSGATTASLHITNISTAMNGYMFRCVVDGVNGITHNLVVNASKTTSAKAAAPATACGNTTFSVNFTSNNTPVNSTIELWENTNGGAFSKAASQTFSASPVKFDVTVAGSATKKYFFTITPPASEACTLPGKSDTVQTEVSLLAAPAFTATGFTLNITNPDASIAYAWQLLSNGVWADVVPASTGSSHKVMVPGNYRLKAVKGNCTAYSASLNVVTTGINPVTPQSAGISLYPNPTAGQLIIDTLKLSDKWQTLDIYHANGKRVITGYTISNQTIVNLNIGRLSPGVYFAVLRRKSGAPVMIKFIKE